MNIYCNYLPHTIFRFLSISVKYRFSFPILRSLPETPIALLKDRFLKKMLLRRAKTRTFFLKTIGSNNSFTLIENNFRFLTLKKPGAGICPPFDIFCYISAGCYFFALKLHDFFPSSLALNLRPFKKIGPRVMTQRCVIERWVQRKTDQKLIFNENYTQIVFFVFRIHFHYVLSYLFGLFGVRTCVSILWHTSLPKNAT